MAYDENNIFARIIRGEIPCSTVYEDDHVLAFKDIQPQRRIHVLVIPKGHYVDMSDFSENASDAEILAYTRAIKKVADKLGVTEDGYRLIANTGTNGHQDVPHLHLHIVGGEPVGPMLKRP
ncbi:MAG TPA: histidine triad nucleotide-binding protein [Rhodospirillaceae bacterium]|nr:histidine triad nucleotide-binding protein [Rhodospirillaceae bacterium]|tara:strand:+ start:99 stop:461 length:363 start_codon:yes stop_codon:yes gene_type:complete